MTLLLVNESVTARRQPQLRSFPSRTRMRLMGALLSICIGLLPATTPAVTLEECITAALEKNPTTNAAAFRVEAAQSSIRQAQAAFYPQLFMSGNYLRSNNPTQAFMMQLNQRQLDMRDPEFDPNDPESAVQCVGNIFNRGARIAGDDSDGSRKCGDRFYMRFVKEPFFG